MCAQSVVQALCRRSAARLVFPLDRGLTPTANTNAAAARLIQAVLKKSEQQIPRQLKLPRDDKNKGLAKAHPSTNSGQD